MTENETNNTRQELEKVLSPFPLFRLRYPINFPLEISKCLLTFSNLQNACQVLCERFNKNLSLKHI